MIVKELLEALRLAPTTADAEDSLEQFRRSTEVRWVPVGRDNNRGTIEVASDPSRSNIERVTNGIDAVLDYEHERHNGLPDCRSPKEAAIAWLDVPDGGLSAMTKTQRRMLAQRLTVRLEPGDGRESRILEIVDRGIGISPENMDKTILSLNESNKMSKHYLVGAYGQGGSSTFAFSRLTLIASRSADSKVGFTLVKFLDLPADKFKTGHYVYLTLADGGILTADLSMDEFPRGTQVRHFGYDLNSYGSPVGPNSLYGSMNTNLFDPVMPVWFDNRVHDYRRVIKGSRNALNGAVDEGDESSGPSLSHSMPMFSVSLGDFGRVGIEYWVLEVPSTKNKKPSQAFVNPSKPIILTLNGQNQGEFSSALIRKDAELPFLVNRLVAHIDCDNLSPGSKRRLFVSNRESQREVKIRELIQDELMTALRSDDVLKELNDKARQMGMEEQDEDALKQMRTEVARLLRLQGLNFVSPAGGEINSNGNDVARPIRPRPPRPPLEPIELHEPPTYVRFVADEDHEFTFYADQRQWVRIETDANSTYHDSSNPDHSKINVIVGDGLVDCGSTPLKGGRMRLVLQGSPTASVGTTSTIRIELKRPGLPVLVDERKYRIVPQPESKPADHQVAFPPFKAVAVNGPEDVKWIQLGWPDNPAQMASAAEMEDGVLMVYYSAVFPKFLHQRSAFEKKDLALALSFTRRYEIWLVVHSLLRLQDASTAKFGHGLESSEDEATGGTDPELEELAEREERCRIAIMSSMFAAREVQMEIPALAEQFT